MADEQIRVYEFIEAVLTRPAMYTMGGSYEEVVAFLDGYLTAAARARPDARHVMEWTALRQFLAERLRTNDAGVFAALRARNADSQAALDDLRRLYAEFREGA